MRVSRARPAERHLRQKADDDPESHAQAAAFPGKPTKLILERSGAFLAHRSITVSRVIEEPRRAQTSRHLERSSCVDQASGVVRCGAPWAVARRFYGE